MSGRLKMRLMGWITFINDNHRYCIRRFVVYDRGRNTIQMVSNPFLFLLDYGNGDDICP